MTGVQTCALPIYKIKIELEVRQFYTLHLSAKMVQSIVSSPCLSIFALNFRNFDSERRCRNPCFRFIFKVFLIKGACDSVAPQLVSIYHDALGRRAIPGGKPTFPFVQEASTTAGLSAVLFLKFFQFFPGKVISRAAKVTDRFGAPVFFNHFLNFQFSE